MASMFEDKKINCEDCKEGFVFTSGEQSFLQGLVDKGDMGQVNLPKRCLPCRKAKKARYAEREINKRKEY